MLRIKDWIVEELVTKFTRAVILLAGVEVYGLNVILVAGV